MNTCKVRIFGHLGNLLASSEASSLASAQAWADAQAPNGEAVVRGATTGDGTVWPDFNGRVLAVRENGRWARV